MIFAIAFDTFYHKMARALINSLNYFHDSPTILVYTTDLACQEIIKIKKEFSNVEVIFFENKGYHYGEWHPLIWAKIEAFNLNLQDYIVFLDVDVILYRNISEFVETFSKSKKIIGASRDFAPFVKQFNSGFDFRQFFYSHFFKNNTYLTAPAFNAGALIFKPDDAIYRELTSLSKRYSNVTFYPEQAILNLFCLRNNGWLEIEDFSIMPFSDKVLKKNQGIGMIHFFTPRPDCMKEPVIREGEPTLSDMTNWFEEHYQLPYPLIEIEQDFNNRLENTFI